MLLFSTCLPRRRPFWIPNNADFSRGHITLLKMVSHIKYRLGSHPYLEMLSKSTSYRLHEANIAQPA